MSPAALVDDYLATEAAFLAACDHDSHRAWIAARDRLREHVVADGGRPVSVAGHPFRFEIGRYGQLKKLPRYQGVFRQWARDGLCSSR
jgi:hypothetical protein